MTSDLTKMLEKMADLARAYPGTAGDPLSLKDGGPGDSDCISTFIASVLCAAGQQCRFVCVQEPKSGNRAVFVEILHKEFGPDGAWIALMPFGQWIFEGPEVLSWERVAQVEVA